MALKLADQLNRRESLRRAWNANAVSVAAIGVLCAAVATIVIALLAGTTAVATQSAIILAILIPVGLALRGVQIQLALVRIQKEQLQGRDSLTGTAHPRQLQNTLTLELTRARRMSTTVTVYLVDMDYFEMVNDHYGCATGDRLLREVAQAIKKASRDDELVARCGSDEFALVTAHATHQNSAALIGRVTAAIKQARLRLCPELPHTACVGQATAKPGDTAQDVLIQARNSLLKAQTRYRTERISLGFTAGDERLAHSAPLQNG